MATAKITSFPSWNLDQGHDRPEPGRHKKEKKSDDSDVIRKWWWEEGGLLEGGVVPAEPDMVAGVDTETRNMFLFDLFSGTL